MVILNQGLIEIRDLLNTEITYAQAGTGTTNPAVTQTALVTAVSNTKNTTTNTVSTSPPSLQVEHVIASAEAIASDLTEWAILQNAGTEPFNRTVTAALTKTSTQEVTRITTIEITQD